jgi:hypothetical protein
MMVRFNHRFSQPLELRRDAFVCARIAINAVGSA